MKQCPVCNQVYSAENEFCVNDGEALIEDANSRYETETVIRGFPIVVNLEEKGAPKSDQPQPGPATAEPGNNSSKAAPRSSYGLLLAGICIGGMLVLATVLVVNLYYSSVESTV